MTFDTTAWHDNISSSPFSGLSSSSLHEGFTSHLRWKAIKALIQWFFWCINYTPNDNTPQTSLLFFTLLWLWLLFSTFCLIDCSMFWPWLLCSFENCLSHFWQACSSLKLLPHSAPQLDCCGWQPTARIGFSIPSSTSNRAAKINCPTSVISVKFMPREYHPTDFHINAIAGSRVVAINPSRAVSDMLKTSDRQVINNPITENAQGEGQPHLPDHPWRRQYHEFKLSV